MSQPGEPAASSPGTAVPGQPGPVSWSHPSGARVGDRRRVRGGRLAVSGRYGFQQDELYFIVAGPHLAFGYVDQPPLAPLLARITDVLGVSPTAIRIIPALAGGGVVVIAARMAALFGAGRFGRVFAALATARAPSSSAPCTSATPRRWTCWPGRRFCSASPRRCCGTGRTGGLVRGLRPVSGSRTTT